MFESVELIEHKKNWIDASRDLALSTYQFLNWGEDSLWAVADIQPEEPEEPITSNPKIPAETVLR